MEIKNGMTYESNYARAAAYLLGTCAPAPTQKERFAAYKLITGIYNTVAEKPVEIGYKPVPDASFIPWERQKGREKDVKAIRDSIKKLEALIEELYRAVCEGEICDGGLLLPDGFKLGKALKNALALNDITVQKRDERIILSMSDECVAGLKELASISKKNIIAITDGPQEDKAYLYFSRCVFEPSENWTAKAFDKLLNADGCLIKLCDELECHGFTRTDCFDGKKVSLDYYRQLGKKKEPLKWAWAERTHLGIGLTYEDIQIEPAYLWIRMPMFKIVLENANKLPQNVRKFLADSTKTCDGCRYCIQTDKTGKRPLSAVSVDGKKKCPNFPGFSMNWRYLSSELAENILQMLISLEQLEELK